MNQLPKTTFIYTGGDLEKINPLLVRLFQDLTKYLIGVSGLYNIIVASGITAARPTTQLLTGQPYFDTTLMKPIYYDVAAGFWRDATGAGPV